MLFCVSFLVEERTEIGFCGYQSTLDVALQLVLFFCFEVIGEEAGSYQFVIFCTYNTAGFHFKF